MINLSQCEIHYALRRLSLIGKCTKENGPRVTRQIMCEKDVCWMHWLL